MGSSIEPSNPKNEAPDKPLVSVVIPVYNGQRYLRQTIDSVLAQTYPAIEVIVVNDGSTDDSAEIIASYGSRLVAINQDNQGVSLARNAGISKAKGRFIALLDHDDWWLPEKIEKQVAVFLADEGIDLVHTGAKFYDEATSSFRPPLNPDEKRKRLFGHCYEYLLQDNVIVSSSVVVRSSVLEYAGYYNPQMRNNTCQDYDLWLRLAKHGRFGYVPERLTVFRVHTRQGMRSWAQVLTDEAKLLERTVIAEGLTRCPNATRRMARLYDQLGTTYMDAGRRRPARQNFMRSLRWRLTARAALLWTACLLPHSTIRTLQRVRARMRRPTDNDPLPPWQETRTGDNPAETPEK